MTLHALLLSAALALFTGAQDADPQPAAADKPREDVIDSHPPGESSLPSAMFVPEAADPHAEAAALQAREIARVEAWFANLDTLSATFLQLAPDGAQSTGTLALDRPGRARFDYDDPSPILLVADGSTVAIADFQLETLDRVPLGATPLAPLLDTGEALSERGVVDTAGRAQGRLYITLIDPEGETDGRLTLIFDDPDPSAPAASMQLSGWYAVDALGGLTEVRLSAVETGVSFDPRLFILDDEDVLGADDRRRGRRR